MWFLSGEYPECGGPFENGHDADWCLECEYSREYLENKPGFADFG